MLGAATAIRHLATVQEEQVNRVVVTRSNFFTTRDFRTREPLSGPNSPQVGDLAILLDWVDTTTLVVPQGWTLISTVSDTGIRFTVSYRILTEADRDLASNLYTGQGGGTSSTRKILTQYRAPSAIASIDIIDLKSQITDAGVTPVDQTMSPGLGTGTDWIGIAAFATTSSLIQPLPSRNFGVRPSTGWVASRLNELALVYQTFDNRPGL